MRELLFELQGDIEEQLDTENRKANISGEIDGKKVKELLEAYLLTFDVFEKL